MDEDNALRVGMVYDTILGINPLGYGTTIGTKPVGKTLYLGKNANNRHPNLGKHVLAFRGGLFGVECWTFCLGSKFKLVRGQYAEVEDSFSQDGKLITKHSKMLGLSESQLKYLEDRLSRAGL